MSERFESWEVEKAHKIKQLEKLGASIAEMGEFLSQFGVQGSTVHGKINAILDMLLETGVITEKQLMDMELKFALDTEAEMKETCEVVRKQAALRGMKVPSSKQSGLIVPGR